MDTIRKLLRIILFASASTTVKAAGDIYTFYDSQNYITYNISFDEDIYDISCTVWNDNQGLITPLSIGLVLHIQDTLMFFDVTNGYNCKAIYSSKKVLKIINGFEVLNGRIFEYWITNKSLDFTKKIMYEQKDRFLNSRNLLDSLIYSFRKHEESNVANLTIDTGLYVDYYATISDSFYFQNVKIEEHRYQYRFNKDVLSEGTWTTFSKYIIFKDETLDTYFIAEIEGNGFTTIKFPSVLPITLKILN